MSTETVPGFTVICRIVSWIICFSLVYLRDIKEAELRE
jgi:hypothetical protein